MRSASLHWVSFPCHTMQQVIWASRLIQKEWSEKETLEKTIRHIVTIPKKRNSQLKPNQSLIYADSIKKNLSYYQLDDSAYLRREICSIQMLCLCIQKPPKKSRIFTVVVNNGGWGVGTWTQFLYFSKWQNGDKIEPSPGIGATIRLQEHKSIVAVSSTMWT